MKLCKNIKEIRCVSSKIFIMFTFQWKTSKSLRYLSHATNFSVEYVVTIHCFNLLSFTYNLEFDIFPIPEEFEAQRVHPQVTVMIRFSLYVMDP